MTWYPLLEAVATWAAGTAFLAAWYGVYRWWLR